MAALTVRRTRDAAAVSLERPRRAFAREAAFTDKDAQEVHAMSSAHMELRPFKDAAYGAARRLLSVDVQAAVATAERPVQVRPPLPILAPTACVSCAAAEAAFEIS